MDRPIGPYKDKPRPHRLSLFIVIKELACSAVQCQVNGFHRQPVSAWSSLGDAAELPPSFSTTKSSITRQSIPEAKKVFNASDGLETIGSPRRLNEVLITTGTPVRRSKAFRIRERSAF